MQSAHAALPWKRMLCPQGLDRETPPTAFRVRETAASAIARATSRMVGRDCSEAIEESACLDGPAFRSASSTSTQACSRTHRRRGGCRRRSSRAGPGQGASAHDRNCPALVITGACSVDWRWSRYGADRRHVDAGFLVMAAIEGGGTYLSSRAARRPAAWS